MKNSYLLLAVLLLFLSCKKNNDKNTPADTFTYSVSGIHNLTIVQGNKDSLQLQVASTGGSPENLSVSVSGLPSGVLAAYSNTTGTPDFSTTITFVTNAQTAAGTYPLKLLLRGAKTGDKTYDINLTISAAISYIINGIHDVTIQQGSDDQLDLAIESVGANPETVTLSLSNLPTGVTADINPTSGTPTYNATAVFTDHYGTAGDYTITLLAHGSASGDSIYQFMLHILNPPDCGILGFYSQGTTGCGNNTNYQYTDNVLTSNVASNRIIFQNFADMPYQVYADINCANNTLTIPNQLLPNGVQVAGSGTFTSNTINVDFSQTSTTNITTYCSFSLIR